MAVWIILSAKTSLWWVNHVLLDFFLWNCKADTNLVKLLIIPCSIFKQGYKILLETSCISRNKWKCKKIMNIQSALGHILFVVRRLYEADTCYTNMWCYLFSFPSWVVFTALCAVAPLYKLIVLCVILSDHELGLDQTLNMATGSESSSILSGRMFLLQLQLSP